jgi:hypothetical protein
MTLSADPLDRDRWILAHSPIEAKKLHAIGFITLKWNACELGLRVLLACVTGKGFAETWAGHHDLGNKEIAKKIKSAVKGSHNSPAVKEAMIYALELYDINRLNRNQFTHFVASAAKNGLELRNNKNPSWNKIFKLPAIRAELADIRRVAEEIDTMSNHFAGLINYFSARLYGGLLAQEPPLPDKPPRPQRLWVPPQAPSSQRQPSPRQSSPV